MKADASSTSPLPGDTRPALSRALDDLLRHLRWLEEEPSGWVWRSSDNSHQLALAVSELRGIPTTRVMIHRIRTGVTTDPRGSIMWAIATVLTRNSPVPITVDYFYDDVVRKTIGRQLVDALELLRETPEGLSATRLRRQTRQHHLRGDSQCKT